ncbi:MAG: hypothetical protein Tsb0020_02310 [Haliangiales bacterium]
MYPLILGASAFLGAAAGGCGGDDGGGIGNGVDASVMVPGEVCDNDIDDDGDNDIDCADNDCSAAPSCQGGGDEICDNNADDDGDGDADCADSDCSSAPSCLGDEICNNNNDDDGDGDSDCSDSDCSGDIACTADCESPLMLADPETVTQTTVGHRDIALGSCQAGGSADVVFAFAPENADVVEFVLSSDADLALFVQTECGNNGAELACVDDAAQESGSERLVLNNVTPGETLYVFVGGAGADDAGAFNLSAASRQIECGDGFVDGDEECDDGNTDNDDGCDDQCVAERVAEQEPNDDGSPEPGGAIPGNDFSAANANGPFADDTLISAAISPAGDEDVFLFENQRPFAASVRFDVFSPELGVGVACGESIDTQLNVRAADGTELAANTDRDQANDTCSGLDLIIPGNGSVYAQVLDFGDNAEIAAYLFRASFAVCGDDAREGLEQCDDGNNEDGDGCTANCEIEAECGNGVTEADEECDDGNTEPGDGCDAECQIENPCGDGITDPDEECDDGNTEPGDGCDAECQIETTCGDGNNEIGEECDDGNTEPGDGCDAECQLESVAESEPNDDGSVATGGLGIFGNDFSAANANGPFSADTLVEAALSPNGDEDVFAISNSGDFDASVRFDLYNAEFGLGESCGSTIDTGLVIRDADGELLESNDNRDGSNDRCSGLDFIVAAGVTVYAHVTDFGDNSVIGGYILQAAFATCGDGAQEGLEECDDGNNAAGDGCNANCQSE